MLKPDAYTYAESERERANERLAVRRKKRLYRWSITEKFHLSRTKTIDAAAAAAIERVQHTGESESA